MNKPLVYLAGPLFSDQDREMLLAIEKAFITAGICCFLPHREVGDLSALKAEVGEDPARHYVFDSDVRGIDDCTIVCALLDGTDVDSGTAAEMGYAHALRKPVFGLCTDQLRRGRTINNVIWGVCGGGHNIYSSVAEAVTAVIDAVVRSGHLSAAAGQKSRLAVIDKHAKASMGESASAPGNK